MYEFLGTISLITGFSCLVLATFLFLAKAERKLPNQLFGIFLVLTAIDVGGWSVLGSGWETCWLDAFRSALGALQMPLFLGFIASSCYSDFKLRMRDVLHALPFLLSLYLTLPGNQLLWGHHPGPNESSVYATNSELIFSLIMSHIQYYLYIAAAVHVLLRFRRVLQQHFADARSEVFVWLSQLVAISIFAHTLLLVRHVAAFGDAGRLFQVLQAVGALLVLAVITWVTFKALMQPELFRGVDRTLLKAEAKLGAERQAPSNGSQEKEKLLSYMVQQKPYMQADLTLKALAQDLAMTQRELSELINSELGVHFFDFINAYRIGAAKALLLDDRTKTVMEVLYEVGFNTKSSFNTAFRKHVLMSPTAFRKANPTLDEKPA